MSDSSLELHKRIVAQIEEEEATEGNADIYPGWSIVRQRRYNMQVLNGTPIQRVIQALAHIRRLENKSPLTPNNKRIAQLRKSVDAWRDYAHKLEEVLKENQIPIPKEGEHD